jgi:hypothetical protein
MTQEYDSADLDAILELQRSPGFALFAARVNATLEVERLECEKPSDTWMTHFAQGQVRALRTVLDIPGILRAEIKATLDGPRRRVDGDLRS